MLLFDVKRSDWLWYVVRVDVPREEKSMLRAEKFKVPLAGAREGFLFMCEKIPILFSRVSHSPLLLICKALGFWVLWSSASSLQICVWVWCDGMRKFTFFSFILPSRTLLFLRRLENTVIQGAVWSFYDEFAERGRKDCMSREKTARAERHISLKHLNTHPRIDDYSSIRTWRLCDAVRSCETQNTQQRYVFSDTENWIAYLPSVHET